MPDIPGSLTPEININLLELPEYPLLVLNNFFLINHSHKISFIHHRGFEHDGSIKDFLVVGLELGKLVHELVGVVGVFVGGCIVLGLFVGGDCGVGDVMSGGVGVVEFLDLCQVLH